MELYPNIYIRKWGSNCHSVELLQKKTVRVVNFKSPVVHTEPILKKYESTQITRFVYFSFAEIILQIIQNFENFIPQYGAYHQNLRNNHIRLPAIRCEFEKNNSKYQMHFRLRELASPSNPPLYPNINITL